MFLPNFLYSVIGKQNIQIQSIAGVTADEIILTTTISSGGFGSFPTNIYFVTSTGYGKVEWWDGTTTQYGTGTPYVSYMYPSKVVSSPYTNSDPKIVKMYSVNSSGVRTGTNYIFGISGIACQLTNLDIRGCTALYMLSVISQPLLPSLTLPSATTLGLLYVSGCTGITNLDLSVVPNASSAQLANNSLTSVNTSGFGASINGYGKSYSAINRLFDLRNNSLSGSALNSIYTGLATNTQFYDAYIYVSGNVGTSSDTPSIATAKGYTVLGS